MRNRKIVVRNRAGKNSFALFLGVSAFSIFMISAEADAQNPFSKLIKRNSAANSAVIDEKTPVPVIKTKPMSLPAKRSSAVYKTADISPNPSGKLLPVPPPPVLPDEEEGFMISGTHLLVSAEPSVVPEPVLNKPHERNIDAAFLEEAKPAPAARAITGGETLEEAWDIALTSSRQLSAKDYERLSADATVRAARGVGLPKISNVTGVHTVSEELAVETNVPLSKILPILPDVQLETPVSDKDFTTSTTALTVPIYMGGRVVNMIQAAQAASNAIACGRTISEQDLKYEVAQTYFLVLRVRHLYEVASEAEKTIAEHENDAQRLLDNGIVTSNVLLAAQVAHANAKQDLIKAENAVNLSQAAYNRLLWRQLDTPVQIAEVEIPSLSGDLDSLTEQAIVRRPELAALSYKSQALSAKARVNRADRLPQVAAVGSYDYFENSHLNENSAFTGSIGVAWTPFDGGVSRNQQTASRFEAMSVTREYEEAESKIRLQVYQCWQDEQETRTRLETAEKAVEQANENLRVVNNGFKEGLTNHTEVLDAQTLRTQAMSNLANARYDAILATYHLRRALGNL